jgi:hypothetical protein
MKKQGWIVTLLALTLLSSCGEKPALPKVSFIDGVPYCYVGEDYDVSEILNEEEGVSYSIAASYEDYYTLKEIAIPNQGLSFTQSVLFDVDLLVTATRSGVSHSRRIIIPTRYRGDPIDELLATSGMAGWADTGFSKELVQESSSLHSETSKSALAVSYLGSNAFPWGGGVLSLNNFRFSPLWSAKDWSNVLVSFWVYNTSAKDIAFELRVKDNFTGLVDTDWTEDSDKAYAKQIAAPGKWTHCLFSLRKIGIEHLLTLNEEGTRNDELTVKCRYDGVPAAENGIPKAYTFTYNIDDIDIVDASAYPSVDTVNTSTNEKVSQGLENLHEDTGWQNAKTLFDYTQKKGEGSTCSLQISFPVPGNENFVSLNPEFDLQAKAITRLPDFTSGTLKGYFKSNSGVLPSVAVKAVFWTPDKSNWVVSQAIAVDFTSPDAEGWCEGSLDVAKLSVFDPIYSREVIRFNFYFIAPPSSGVYHLDTLKLV